MRILLVTEKFSPSESQCDGGTRMVNTLTSGFKGIIDIMQFGGLSNSTATWKFDYPINLDNRFKKRIANAKFIAEKVKIVEEQFTHIIFMHISMQFGFTDINKLRKDTKIWTFPMFLTPSYQISGEIVPLEYTKMEFSALANTQNILTPSYLEKKQLTEFYSIPEQKIYVIPRGIDNNSIVPKIRFLDQPITFCSVSSIKSQKNILGLVELFNKIKDRYPKAQLNIIGPVQDQKYYDLVDSRIRQLKLNDIIKFTGYITPNELAAAIENAHLHISNSKCETFGRSIFETLASGLPNIVMLENNAAADFLSGLPYIKFVSDDNQTLIAIEEILNNLSELSEMAFEIGELYNEEMLKKLLIARINSKDAIAISDFDGTLFHKNDLERTKKCMLQFQQFSKRIICSARSHNDLLGEIKKNNLKVDWIIAYSGAVITDGDGNIISITAIDEKEARRLKAIVPKAKRITVLGKVVQLFMNAGSLPNIVNFNVEIYQKIAFVSSWQSSKLRAIHRLLNHIDWSGTVKAFGDGRYDREFLTYFDGKFIKSENSNNLLEMEETYE